MEAGDPTVTVDLLVKSLLALGVSKKNSGAQSHSNRTTLYYLHWRQAFEFHSEPRCESMVNVQLTRSETTH